MKIKRDIIRGLIVFWISLGGGCARGPVEILDELSPVASPRCGPGARCAAEGIEAAKEQDYSQAMTYFHEGCRLGELLACRRLGDGYVRGEGGVVDHGAAHKLYEWGCIEGDGAACHSLGELERLRAGAGDLQAPRAAFWRACELGEVTGCHDRAVIELMEGEDDGEEAAQVLGELCEAGLMPACTNFANLLARGHGVSRDRSRALALFDESCDRARAWQDHPLASLARGGSAEEPELFTTSQFDKDAPCRQLQVLATGSFEERVIAAFVAEEAALTDCYKKVREPGQEQVGRITFEAQIGADGANESLDIISDTLKEESVKSCAERLMSRHLVDGTTGEARFDLRFDLSFIHGPRRAAAEEEPAGCAPQEVRRALEEISFEVQRCGRRQLARPESTPGIALVRWSFAQSGRVEDMAMTTTLDDTQTVRCLKAALQEMEIPSFDSGACPVQAPFVFSRGDQLHFTIILR